MASEIQITARNASVQPIEHLAAISYGEWGEYETE
jgi:hypothetical protein